MGGSCTPGPADGDFFHKLPNHDVRKGVDDDDDAAAFLLAVKATTLATIAAVMARVKEVCKSLDFFNRASISECFQAKIIVLSSTAEIVYMARWARWCVGRRC